jgi:hypothetical protein
VGCSRNQKASLPRSIECVVIPLAGSQFINPGEGCGHFDTDYGSSRIDDSDHCFVDDRTAALSGRLKSALGR